MIRPAKGALPNRLVVVYNNSEIPVEANAVSVHAFHVGDELIEIFLQSLTFSRLSDIHIGLRLYLRSFILGVNQSRVANLLQVPQPPLSKLMLLSKVSCTVVSNLVKSCQTTSFTLIYFVQVPPSMTMTHSGHHPAKWPKNVR